MREDFCLPFPLQKYLLQKVGVFMLIFMLFVCYIVKKWSSSKGKAGISEAACRVIALKKEKNLKLSEFSQT